MGGAMTKIRIVSSAAVVIVSAISSVVAAQASEAINFLLTQHGFEVAGQSSRYHYEEPGLMKLTGGRVGVTGAYTFLTGGQWYSKVDGRYSYGALRYEGSGTMESVPDTIIEVRFVEGRDFLPSRGISLSPYGGIGYRYLYNDLRGYSSTGAVGYRRYSNYLYIPVGLSSRIGDSRQFVVNPTFEYDFFLRGKQLTKLSDTGLGYSDATNTQDSGYGYRLSLMFEVDRFAFGPWMNYWKIEDSDIVFIGKNSYGLEPKNWTREVGVEFKYKF